MVASIFYACGSGIYFIASKYIGSGLAMVIFFVYPIIIILFNCLFYRHKIERIYYISVFLLLLGLGCLIRKDEVSFDLYGISFALLSALFYGVYIIYSQKKISLPPLESTFAISMGSSILCFIIALCEGSLIIPASTTLWFNIIGMALICTVIPILFLLEGLKLISAEKAALLSVLEPVFVLIIGAWLLNEQVSMIQYFGVLAILSSAIIATKSN
jgi:drug/metabolite transporter (DMT)-like permease